MSRKGKRRTTAAFSPEALEDIAQLLSNDTTLQEIPTSVWQPTITGVGKNRKDAEILARKFPLMRKGPGIRSSSLVPDPFLVFGTTTDFEPDKTTAIVTYTGTLPVTYKIDGQVTFALTGERQTQTDICFVFLYNITKQMSVVGSIGIVPVVNAEIDALSLRTTLNLHDTVVFSPGDVYALVYQDTTGELAPVDNTFLPIDLTQITFQRFGPANLA